MILLLNANVRHAIPLADESVQCVVTSPPYWGKRDYKNKAQIGHERTPEAYTAVLVEVFREVWRVLKPSGVVFLNLGDTFFQGKKGNSGGHILGAKQATNVGSVQVRRGEMLSPSRNQNLPGLKAKDLVGIPWMVAFALRADGWYLRSEVIWHKPNPMPESVTDRPTCSHEQIFLLSKSKRYYYDAEAIKEKGYGQPAQDQKKLYSQDGQVDRLNKAKAKQRKEIEENGFVMRNKRTVWTIPTYSYSGAHFATFPPELVLPMILAGSKPGDVILDPFSGTATVGKVALENRRQYVGLELNAEYIELAKDRITTTLGLL